ncbi:unnamed protein product [Durusdinium trenchii]|uniref:Uncharacterized protein n=2 Tax=Durusdinium trenchii TaxID=1381693 RepID=A0ABP0K1H1_9DINO
MWDQPSASTSGGQHPSQGALDDSSASSSSASDDELGLHHLVPPDRWCITREDLAFLRKEIYHGIQKGEIKPHQTDDFQTADQVFGPSIYTVNEQYIKPVTKRAGKMSWALMRNPKGLECHLFISHAWEEGIYEFIRKVMHSWIDALGMRWPRARGMRHAWCCMLANPQNLNIAALIQSPKKSPFAVALRASKMVLVVPNWHRSVYTRLWCGYEAYLAQEAGKPIAIAGTSVRHWTWRSLKYMCFAAVPGVILGQYVNSHGWKWFRWFLWLPSLAALLGLNAQDHEYSILVHGFCEMVCWIEIANCDGSFPNGHEWGFPDVAYPYVHLWYWVMAASFFCLMEVDRIHFWCNRWEAEQLKRDYRGSIRYAECSQPEDAQRIQLEIGQEEKFQEVDDAIQVLLTARMSSPALCHIASLGVDIDQAAYSEITAAVVVLGPFDLLTLGHLLFEMIYEGSQQWHIEVLQGMSIMGRFLLLWQLYRSPMDERCFLLKVLSKLVAVLMVALFLLLFIAVHLHFRPLFSWLVFTDAVLLFAVTLSFLGIRGTAQLPGGLCLLKVFFARGSKLFRCGPHSEAATATGTEFGYNRASGWNPRSSISDHSELVRAWSEGRRL